MAKKVIAANLLDMIELITSRKLQEAVFTQNAPNMNVKWDRLPKNNRRRAQILHDEMENLISRRNKTLREQHSKLFRTLNTIALVNADSTNTAEIEDRIKNLPALNRYLQDSFTRYDLPAGHSKTANLVAFINVVMLSEKETNAGKDAKSIWDDLVASATAALDAIKHDSFKVFPPKSDYNRTDGLQSFEEVLRFTVSTKFHEREYLVMVACENLETHVRYLVKTTPLDHDVSKVVRDRSGKRRFENRPDDNAEAFEIRYFESHNRLEISRPRIIETKDVANMFAQHVLGTKLDDRPKRYYDDPLQIFKSRECLKTIKLPKENVTEDDRLWIQEIKLAPVQVSEGAGTDAEPRLIKHTPTTYTGNEDHFVFTEMDNLLDPNKFPRERCKILRVEVALRLFKAKLINGKLQAETTSKTYVVRISERHFTVLNKNKVHDHRLLSIFEQIQTDWGFEGLTPEEHKTSRGRVSVKGERSEDDDGDDLFGNI